MSEKIYTMFPTLAVQPPVAAKAKGVVITDENGKEYLDFSSGVAVVNIGHGVQEIKDAVVEQMDKFSFVYRGMFANEPLLRLSKQIIDLAPEGMERVFFCSGGSEANESAIKIARQYQVERGKPSKYKIISRWQSYHGNTLATLAVGGRCSWRWPYDPLLMKNPHIPQCNCYHCPFGMKYPGCGIQCAKELERTIQAEGADTVCAFIYETVTGAAGSCVIPPKEYFPMVKEICEKYDVLMIDDEVITGFGRTGKNFACEHYGYTPDLIATAKGMGSGYVPIGGVIVNKKIVDAFESGSGSLIHSFTYASHSVACAASSAVLKYMVDHDLFNRVREMGPKWAERLETLKDLPMVGDVRCIGLMSGITFVKDKETRESYPPTTHVADQVFAYCFDHGLMVLPGSIGSEDGIKGDAMMVNPPFVVEEEQMDKAIGILTDAIKYVYEQISADKEMDQSARPIG